MDYFRILLTCSLVGLYACRDNAKNPQPEEENLKKVTTSQVGDQKNLSIGELEQVDRGLMLTPEQELCTQTYPELKAENIRSGVILAGIEGTATEHPICSETVTVDCITTSAFPAVKTEGIASKVLAGQTVAGVAGTAVEAKEDCNAADQSDCIATSTYKTIDLSSKDSGGALDLTTANFEARMASASSFEYWDEDGNRHTNTGDADLTSNNIKSGVNIFGTDGPTDSLNCASISFGTWIMIPGDPDYGTSDFCVMKYEAKNNLGAPSSTATGSPWVNIDQQDAITECASLGKGFQLISNDQWMTITSNAASVASNWTGGLVGSGDLFKGHSDGDPNLACPADANDDNAYVETDCTGQNAGGTEDNAALGRVHTLTNGNKIWDLSGNVREWIHYFNDTAKPTPDSSYNEYTTVVDTTTMPLSDLIPTSEVKSFWSNSWDASQSIGKARFGANGSGGSMTRGGGFTGASNNGLFRVRLDDSPTTTRDTLGFRCTVAMP